MTTTAAPLVHDLELNGGLASLASAAAVELDQLRLGRASTLAAVGAVLSRLDEIGVPGDSADAKLSLDPSALVVVLRAVQSPLPAGGALPGFSELRADAEAVGTRLRGVFADPVQFSRDPTGDLSQLVEFLLKLSRQAALSEEPTVDESEHPYRR